VLNHRRPNNDELTPDDLFRPEPSPAQYAGGTTIPGEVVRSSDMPWNTPAQPEYYGGDAQPDPYQQQYPPQAPYPQQPVEEASTQFMPPFPAEPQQQQMPPARWSASASAPR